MGISSKHISTAWLVLSVKPHPSHILDSSSATPYTDCLRYQDSTYANSVLVSNIMDLEHSHQSAYLGLDGAVRQLDDPATYKTWTNEEPNLDVYLYLDTRPPVVLTERKGVFEIGNRFIAASRETLYLTLSNNSNQIMWVSWVGGRI